MKVGYGLQGLGRARHPEVLGHPGDPRAGRSRIRRFEGSVARAAGILGRPEGCALLPRVAASEAVLASYDVPFDAVVPLPGIEPAYFVRGASYGLALDLALAQASAFGYRHPSGPLALYALGGQALIPELVDRRPAMGADAAEPAPPVGGAAGAPGAGGESWFLRGGSVRPWSVLRGPVTRWSLDDHAA